MVLEGRETESAVWKRIYNSYTRDIDHVPAGSRGLINSHWLEDICYNQDTSTLQVRLI